MHKKSMLLISILIAATMTLSPILLSNSTFGQAKPPSPVKLPDNSVRSETIVDGQVQPPDIAKGGVLTIHLADGSVTNQKIADKSVTNNKISDDSVTTGKISDGTIIGQDINPAFVKDLQTPPPNSVSSPTILDGTIIGQDIDSAFIKDLQTPPPNSVSSPTILDGSILVQDINPSALKGLQGKLDVASVSGPPTKVLSGETLTGFAKCSLVADSVLTGGGFEIAEESLQDGDLKILNNHPNPLDQKNAWQVTAYNSGDSPSTFTPMAQCSKVVP
jgi:hypothetical protein